MLRTVEARTLESVAMRRRLPLAVLVMLPAILAAQTAGTHQFVPERFYNTFSFAHPPALLPVFAHLAIVLMLGIYVPPYLADWYRAAAQLIGGE